jgi:hypothetical protein
MVVPSRRLEDRIRELCEKVLKARESEFGPTLSTLQAALHEHTERIRRVAADQALGFKGPGENRRAACWLVVIPE